MRPSIVKISTIADIGMTPGQMLKTHTSLRHLKVTIRNRKRNSPNIPINQPINTSNIAKDEDKSTSHRKKYVFRKPRTIQQVRSYPHQPTLNKREQKSIRLYLQEINDTPTEACTLCEMLCFKKDICKVTSAFVNAFSLLSVRMSDKIIASNQMVCKHCVDVVVHGNLPDYTTPWNIRQNKRIPLVQTLTSLEERLVSLRIAFAQIRQLG